jgi:hypothetical protein
MDEVTDVEVIEVLADAMHLSRNPGRAWTDLSPGEAHAARLRTIDVIHRLRTRGIELYSTTIPKSKPPVLPGPAHDHLWIPHRTQPGVAGPFQPRMTVVLYVCGCGELRSEAIAGTWTIGDLKGAILDAAPPLTPSGVSPSPDGSR